MTKTFPEHIRNIATEMGSINSIAQRNCETSPTILCMKIQHADMFKKDDLRVEQEQRWGIYDAMED